MPGVRILCENDEDGISDDPAESRCPVKIGLGPAACEGVAALAATAAAVAAEAAG